MCMMVPCIIASMSSFSDIRCKCICPRETGANYTNIVIFNNLTAPSQCTCQHVVRREETFCLKCECKFETRNSMLIKGIVMFVVVCLFILCIYMAMVAIHLKFNAKKELSVTSDAIQEQLKEPIERKKTLSFKSIDRKISAWQQKVDVQRNNVFDSQAVCG